MEGSNPYEVWKRMSNESKPLLPGDLLEAIPAEETQTEVAGSVVPGSAAPRPMWIAKYIGFEPAQWFVPEARPAAVAEQVGGDREGVRPA